MFAVAGVILKLRFPVARSAYVLPACVAGDIRNPVEPLSSDKRLKPAMKRTDRTSVTESLDAGESFLTVDVLFIEDNLADTESPGGQTTAISRAPHSSGTREQFKLI